MAKRKINDLLKHLKKYKDAVIIIGNNTITKKIIVDDETKKESIFFQPDKENKEIFSRKAMIKEPKEFWKFYKENIMNDCSEDIDLIRPYELTKELTDMNIIKSLIDFNTDGILSNVNVEYIPMKGNRNILQCVKCKQTVDISNIDLNTEEVIIHSKCNESIDCKGKIKPSIPFFGEEYEQKNVSDMFRSIFKYDDNDKPIGLNTHTLFLIGADFTENIIDEIIEGFNRFKGKDNALSVFITDGEDLFMNAYMADFGTTYDVSESLNKFIELLKKE